MWETVLEVGGEGGRITLRGMRLNDQQWLFTKVRDESTLIDFLDAEDVESLGPFLKGQSKAVVGFEQAVQLLNKAWPRFVPRVVHPEFRERIWNIVSQAELDSFHLSEWEELCFRG